MGSEDKISFTCIRLKRTVGMIYVENASIATYAVSMCVCVVLNRSKEVSSGVKKEHHGKNGMWADAQC